MSLQLASCMITSAIVVSPFFFIIVMILKKKFGWFKDNNEKKETIENKNEFEEIPNTDRSVIHNTSSNDISVD